MDFNQMFSQKILFKHKYNSFFYQKKIKKEQHQDGFTKLPLVLLATLPTLSLSRVLFFCPDQNSSLLRFFLYTHPLCWVVLQTEENDDGGPHFRGRSSDFRRPFYGGDVMGRRRRRGSCFHFLLFC